MSCPVPSLTTCMPILLLSYYSNCVAPLPHRPYPAALAFYRNFKVWGERVLLLGRPTSPLPPGNLQHEPPTPPPFELCLMKLMLKITPGEGRSGTPQQ